MPEPQPVEIRERSKRVPLIVAGLVLIAALVVGGVILYAIRSGQEARDQDRELTKRLALEQVRSCIRNNILSATFVYSVEQQDTDSTPAERHRNRALVDHLYPVLWCARSLSTGRSVALPLDEKRKYVDIVGKGRAPIVSDDGRVIGSRKTVLEGITVLEETGSQEGRPQARP